MSIEFKNILHLYCYFICLNNVKIKTYNFGSKRESSESHLGIKNSLKD